MFTKLVECYCTIFRKKFQNCDMYLQKKVSMRLVLYNLIWKKENNQSEIKSNDSTKVTTTFKFLILWLPSHVHTLVYIYIWLYSSNNPYHIFIKPTVTYANGTQMIQNQPFFFYLHTFPHRTLKCLPNICINITFHRIICTLHTVWTHVMHTRW